MSPLFRRTLALSLLSLTGAFTAPAAITEFLVTGEVTTVGDFDFVDPLLQDIPAVGDTFTATFKLDDSKTITSTPSSGVAIYGGALLDVVMSLPDSGITVTAATVPVWTRVNFLLYGIGLSDEWSAFVLDGTGTSAPSLPTTDGGPASPDEFSMTLFDTDSPGIFPSSPAPLVSPALGDFDLRSFKFRWEDDLGLTPFVNGTITSIVVVPEPSALALLGLAGLLGLLALRRRA